MIVATAEKPRPVLKVFGRPPGRATKLSPQVQDLILAAVSVGTTLESAADLAGVSPQTVREWRRRGKGQDDRPATEPYTTFAKLLDKAEASFEIKALGALEKAARNGQWRASAWLLERRFPGRWGRKPRTRAARRRPKTVDPPALPLALSESEFMEEGKPWEDESELLEEGEAREAESAFLEEGELREDEDGWMRDERETLKLP